jgi:hypothetical protein
MEKEKLEFQKMFQDKLVELNDFLDKVKKLGKGQIDIIDR